MHERHGLFVGNVSECMLHAGQSIVCDFCVYVRSSKILANCVRRW